MVPLAHFSPQGSAYLQMDMGAALSGCAKAHARWPAWKRGGSAALRWLALAVRWLPWWGRWMCWSVAADFVMADNVDLLWPSSRGGIEWEWRVVSLKDIFWGGMLALCLQDRDVGPEEELGGWHTGDAHAGSRTNPEQRRTGPQQRGGQPARQGGEEGHGE